MSEIKTEYRVKQAPRNITGKNVGRTVSKRQRYFTEENARINVDENGIRYKLGPILYARGITMKDFAAKTGTREGTVIDFVKGRIKRIPADFIAKVCKELNCNVHDLMDYVPPEDVE